VASISDEHRGCQYRTLQAWQAIKSRLRKYPPQWLRKLGNLWGARLTFELGWTVVLADVKVVKKAG